MRKDTILVIPRIFNGIFRDFSLSHCRPEFYKCKIFMILSMDLHPSRDMVASGQRAGRTRKTQAHIRIWSTESLLTLYVFGMGEFEVGVSAVAFSQLV